MRLDVDRSDLVAMISKVMSADGTEQELDDLLRHLICITSMPQISDMIFYPDEEMSAEDIADAIFNHHSKLIG